MQCATYLFGVTCGILKHASQVIQIPLIFLLLLSSKLSGICGILFLSKIHILSACTQMAHIANNDFAFFIKGKILFFILKQRSFNVSAFLNKKAFF